MAVIVSGGCYKFSVESVGGSWSWAVQANNTQGAGQLYQVTDINTPYGPLTVIDVPIPSDVIVGMADSITDVQGQLAPLMTLIGSTTSFNVVVTEGDPNVAVGSVTVMNSGAFGSFMTATATAGVQWLSVSPSSHQGIGKNEQVTFDIVLMPASLLATDSPFSGTVTLQDNRVPPTQIPITVSATVLPRPEISVNPSSLGLTFMSSTGVPGGSQQLTISNSGPILSSLEFTLASINNESWLSFVPTSGGPLAYGESSIVTVSVSASGAGGLVPGTYSDTIRVSSTKASNSPVDVPVTLTVT